MDRIYMCNLGSRDYWHHDPTLMWPSDMRLELLPKVTYKLLFINFQLWRVQNVIQL
jgi:hypothetical protein